MNKITKKRFRLVLALAGIISMTLTLTLSVRAYVNQYSTATLNTSAVARNARVILMPYMTYQYVEVYEGESKTDFNPYKQSSYLLPSRSPNYGCGIVSNAIGRSIVTKKSVNPLNYLSGGDRNAAMCTNPSDQLGSRVTIQKKNTLSELQKIYDYINKGQPVRLYSAYSNGKTHFVVVNGYFDGARRENLTYSDFICIDPYTGMAVKLTDSCYWNSNTYSERNYRVFLK